MNNIEKLQNIFQELKKDDESGHSSAYELQWEDIEAIENLIKENKELKEYQYKINEIMNFDEENLDTTRVANNYIGLKNCVTQFRKQVEKLEESQCVYKDTSSCNKALSFETYRKLNDYIPKSKVREKIEEYDDKGMTVNLVNRSAGKTFQQAVHYEVKKVLQSLLEKE